MLDSAKLIISDSGRSDSDPIFVSRVLFDIRRSEGNRLIVDFPLSSRRPQQIDHWWNEVLLSGKPLAKKLVVVQGTSQITGQPIKMFYHQCWICSIGLNLLDSQMPSAEVFERVEIVFETCSLEYQPVSAVSEQLSSKEDRFTQSLSTERAKRLSREIDRLQFSPGYGKAVFWTGDGQKALAEKYALENNLTTLEMTPGGKYLDGLNLFDPDSGVSKRDAIRLWRKASQKYAEQAEGPVKAFEKVRDYAKMKRSTFRSVEFPVLKKNPKVTLLDHRLDWS